MKIIVYTAIFGAYDSQLIELEYDRDIFEFVCFTNQKRLKSKTWNVKYVEIPPVPNDNPRSSYYYKTNPHKLWKDNDISIWMDSSCNRLDTKKLYKMVEKFNQLGSALYIEKHPGRTCIYDELETNCRLNKDDVPAMRAHVDSYRKEGMPKKFGMVETGLQIRKHNNPEVVKFQEMLWNEMKTKTRRDQLSWTYCQWKLDFQNFSLFTFQEKIDVLWFQDHPHKSNHSEKVLLIGPWYGDPVLEKKWVEYAEEYVGKIPMDTVIVGCRPGREDIYENIKPDKFFISNPEGVVQKNLLNGKVPFFGVKSKGDKTITQLNPTNEIINKLKLYDGSIHFKVEITGWRSEKYIEACLKSLLSQKHTNWEACVMLDPDEDGNKTFEIANKYVSDKIQLLMNEKRMGSLYNHRKCVTAMKPNPEDVIVTLDSDDWFAHDNVLTMIENAYLGKPDTLVTHGSWIDFPNPGSLQPNNSHPYRREEFDNIRQAFFRGSHVRTMKAKIWNSIKEEDLKGVDGKYFETAGDVALMIPALEMAGFDRVTFIPDVMYIYNRESSLNDDKIRTSQGQHHMQIVQKPKYSLYQEVVNI